MYATHEIGLTARSLPPRAGVTSGSVVGAGPQQPGARWAGDADRVLLSSPSAVLQLLASSEESYAQLTQWRAERLAEAEEARAAEADASRQAELQERLTLGDGADEPEPETASGEAEPTVAASEQVADAIAQFDAQAPASESASAEPTAEPSLDVYA